MRKIIEAAPRARSSEEITGQIVKVKAAIAEAEGRRSAAAAIADRDVFEAADGDVERLSKELVFLVPQRDAALARESEARKAAEEQRLQGLKQERNKLREEMLHRATIVDGYLQAAAKEIGALHRDAQRFSSELGGSSSVAAVLTTREGTGSPINTACFAAGLAEYLTIPRTSAHHWSALQQTVGMVIGGPEE